MKQTSSLVSQGEDPLHIAALNHIYNAIHRIYSTESYRQKRFDSGLDCERIHHWESEELLELPRLAAGMCVDAGADKTEHERKSGWRR